MEKQKYMDESITNEFIRLSRLFEVEELLQEDGQHSEAELDAAEQEHHGHLGPDGAGHDGALRLLPVPDNLTIAQP